MNVKSVINADDSYLPDYSVHLVELVRFVPQDFH